MQACQATKDSLSEMSDRLEEIALSFEPAVNEPTELRLIAQLINQFKQRPLEPLSFQSMHIDHLIDVLDNADSLVELWSAVDQTLADYYVSQHYNNMDPLIEDNYLEILPKLHLLACSAHTAIMNNPIHDAKVVDFHRAEMMTQVQAISNTLSQIKKNQA